MILKLIRSRRSSRGSTLNISSQLTLIGMKTLVAKFPKDDLSATNLEINIRARVVPFVIKGAVNLLGNGRLP